MKKVFLKGYIVPVCVYTMACEHLDTVQLSAIKFLAKVILAISTCHGEMDNSKDRGRREKLNKSIGIIFQNRLE